MAERKHGRVVLNKTLAAEVYAHKLALTIPTSFKSCLQVASKKTKGESAKLALKYGVSAKTVRDVWNKKTWADATAHLWKEEPYQVGSNATACRFLFPAN
jgi:hypothetical protein